MIEKREAKKSLVSSLPSPFPFHIPCTVGCPGGHTLVPVLAQVQERPIFPLSLPFLYSLGGLWNKECEKEKKRGEMKQNDQRENTSK